MVVKRTKKEKPYVQVACKLMLQNLNKTTYKLCKFIIIE